MELGIRDQLFIVTGASSGFGKAVATRLLEEGANILVIARREELLNEFVLQYPEQANIIAGDLTDQETLNRIPEFLGSRQLHGILVNAGGPPARKILNTSMQDWDKAYQIILRWKVNLLKELLPKMIKHHYGRIVMIESQSIKQPIENLVLSNAFRAAVAGFAKTLSQEVADKGINVNLIAPGSHDTPAIERIIKKNSEVHHISYQEARQKLENNIPMKRLGKPEELAALATWLLSPQSSYITGQTIGHDGGNIRHIFG